MGLDQVKKVEGEQFSDYSDKSLSSLSLCGLPLAPMPWLNMWEMALEEREDKETWERTRWTWGISDTCNKSGQRTEQWVTEMRDLPPPPLRSLMNFPTARSSPSAMSVSVAL